VLALRKALAEFPEKYRLYKVMLENCAADYGIAPEDVAGIDNPVLVRERLTPVDRVKFAAEANTTKTLSMSPFEQALQDASKISDQVINTMQVNEDQTIDQALRARINNHVIDHFISTIPDNERASIADSKGNISAPGMQRLKLALFAKTYTGESGQRLTRIFSESIDPHQTFN
jgi:hypothetical protein